MADVLQPLADGLAAMKDEDASTCSTPACRRCSASRHGWANIWSASQRVPMFQDIDLAVMLPLALRVITENLGPFIQGCLPARPAAPGDTGWLKRLPGGEDWLLAPVLEDSASTSPSRTARWTWPTSRS